MARSRYSTKPKTRLSDEEIETLPKRVMDCLDCHNRPAHVFEAPMNSVNRAISAGLISRKLPYIKVEAVRALDNGYETLEEAQEKIPVQLEAFYREEYPEEFEEHREALASSIEAVQMIYERTIFPEMRADWSTHVNNIGHRDSPGCFRCHNDEMEDEDGEAIFTTCTKCTSSSRRPTGMRKPLDSRTSTRGVSFVHPEDGDTIEEYAECSDCHTGGIEVYE